MSARKYRPSTFRSVVGQKTLANTLKNAINGKKLAQAYLFCGPRGVGKTSCARIFAKTINCLHPDAEGEACGECESCKAIERGNSFDLVELDAASNNSVDDIRSITEQVNVPPQNGRYRVFIIDEVHMLSNNAFNAFLKTLEEPPANVIFILATTEKHKVIPTILSRCQIYDFKRITVNDTIDHLEYVAGREGIHTEREALGVIALKADGAMRDALSIFDQIAASTGGDVTYEKTLENLNVLDYDYYFRMIDFFKTGDVGSALLLYKEIRDKGFDSLFFVNGLASHIRDLMVAFDPRTVKLLETSEEVEKKFLEQAPSLPIEWYYKALKLLNDCDINYRTATNKRLLVELTLIRLATLLKGKENPFDLEEEAAPHLPPLGKQPSVAPRVSSEPPAPQLKSEEHSSHIPQEKTPPSVQAPKEKPFSPSPQTQPQRPAAPKGRDNRPKSFRLSESLNAANNPESSVDKRVRPFTEEEFMIAWHKFMSTHAHMHILVNAMRSSSPEKTGETDFRVKVEHPAQLQAFESAMSELLAFMRNELGNDLLTIFAELDEDRPQPVRMQPRDLLKKMIEENPVLGDFLGKIEGEIL